MCRRRATGLLEPDRRILIPAAISKTRKALWVDLDPILADAIEAAIGPREDRTPDAPLFPEPGSDAAAHRDREGVPRGRHPAVVAARPAGAVPATENVSICRAL